MRSHIPWLALAFLAGLGGVASPTAAQPSADHSGELFPWVIADRDDDDTNGRVDGEELALRPAARGDLLAIDARFSGAEIHPVSGGDRARILVDGRPWPWGRAMPPG